MKEIQFGEVTSNILFENLAHSRYSVFVKELKRVYPSQYIQSGKLIEPIDDYSKNLVLLKDSYVIGGIRITELRGDKFPLDEFVNKYKLDEYFIQYGVYLSKLFITPPNNRNKRYLPYFLANIFVFLIRSDVKYVYLNTNPELENLYKKLGFEEIGDPFFLDEVEKTVIPMRAILDDKYISKCTSTSFKQYLSNLLNMDK